MLIFCCLGVGGNILYKSYKFDCESYNRNILDFAVDMIKGNHSYYEIDDLDAPDEVKESLKNYYLNSFYTSSDKVLIYEDIDGLLDQKNDVVEYIAKVNLPINSEEFYMQMESDFTSYFYGSQEEENKIDKATEHLIYGLYNISFESKDSDYLFIENDNLYAVVDDLVFTNGENISYYGGFKFTIYRDALDKKICSEIQNDPYYQSYKISSIFKEDGKTVCILKDDLSNSKYIKYDTSFGRISSIQL